MALAQQKFREMVFQLLYSYDIGQPDDDSMIELIMEELAVSKKNVRMAQEKMNEIVEKIPELDAKISSVSSSYEFERIQSVTKNILRLSLFELLYDPSIPPKVVIAESMRLSRKFGSPESATFVNALMDQLYQEKVAADDKAK